MSRKQKTYGVCRLCGENKELTFEHVPPETVFNKGAVRNVSLDAIIKDTMKENKLPWEINYGKGKIQQRGRGGFYLCSDCNSCTGQWYVPYYSRFVHAIQRAMRQTGEQKYESLGLRIKSIRPLPIFKQVMTMFCDINGGLMGDDSLKYYLLNKTSRSFNRNRYHLYVHIHAGTLERMNGIMVQSTNFGIITLSEISTYPVGFTLYIDKPKNYKPEGVEITSFSEWDYGDESDVQIIIPKLECNTIFSGDYRTKGEITGSAGGKAQIGEATTQG